MLAEEMCCLSSSSMPYFILAPLSGEWDEGQEMEQDWLRSGFFAFRRPFDASDLPLVPFLANDADLTLQRAFGYNQVR
jgi:hypothetical protein